MAEDGTSFSIVDALAHSRENGLAINNWMRNLLARLDEKWGVAILAVLSEGNLRYSELSRCLPCVSQRMLTLSLRKLERDGLIERTVTPSHPPHVVYTLTEVGLSLHRRLLMLTDWAVEHEEYIRRSRARFDSGSTSRLVAGDSTVAGEC